jgi:hypothetical protein
LKRVTIVYYDTGAGHRSTALAIQRAVELAGLPWDVKLVSLQKLLDPLDVLRILTGVRVEDVYNTILRNGRTFAFLLYLRSVQVSSRLLHRPMVNLLAGEWSTSSPDLLVSVVPVFNRVLRDSFELAHPGRPFVTVMTDLADYPPRYWIERQRQYIVCGSARAAAQAAAAGHTADRVFRSSGMIVHPRFYEQPPIDRGAERARLGLDPDRPTGLVMFGGHAPARTMLLIDRLLGKARLPLQLILLCGRTPGLVGALRAQHSDVPRWIEGFTRDVPHYMQVSDFFIGKPGPGSLSEALAMGLPVIIERNAWTLPQERYNARWVREQDVGIVVRTFSDVDRAVGQLLEPSTFDRLRSNARGMSNRALYEFLDIASQLVGEALRPSNADVSALDARVTTL